MTGHTFAVCAYRDSPFLGACLASLKSQTVKSDIILCTSTPSEYITDMADKFDIPVSVRSGSPKISSDWNFAYESAKTDLVTIAHQDDIYGHNYTRILLENSRRYEDMSVFSTASVTIRDGHVMKNGNIERTKMILRLPLRFKSLSHLGILKKASLIFGNPIICPSCTYNKKLCGPAPFSDKYEFALDWDLLLRLAGKKGRFVCIEKPLILYRVHNDSATGDCLNNHVRQDEEKTVFHRIWKCGILADMILKFYGKSYRAYD